MASPTVTRPSAWSSASRPLLSEPPESPASVESVEPSVESAVAPEGRPGNAFEAVHLDLGEPAGDEVLNRILAAAWPAGVLAAEA